METIHREIREGRIQRDILEEIRTEYARFRKAFGLKENPGISYEAFANSVFYLGVKEIKRLLDEKPESLLELLKAVSGLTSGPSEQKRKRQLSAKGEYERY